LILIFVPQIPAIMSWYRVHMSRVIMTQLEFGVEEYRRVYGELPLDLYRMHADRKRLLNGLTDTGSWTDPGACHYGNAPGYLSLCLILQGPDGNGWGPTEDFPDMKEFGPIPESPGYAVRDTRYENWRYFECPFGRPILYYMARMDSTYADITLEKHPQDELRMRYIYLINQDPWEYGSTGGDQRGADELPTGAGIMNSWVGKMHWSTRLTRSKDAAGYRYPYNPTSYLLWMAGADARFGYWVWSDQYHGFIVDPKPEDASDGRVGVCDDVTNF